MRCNCFISSHPLEIYLYWIWFIVCCEGDLVHAIGSNKVLPGSGQIVQLIRDPLTWFYAIRTKTLLNAHNNLFGKKRIHDLRWRHLKIWIVGQNRDLTNSARFRPPNCHSEFSQEIISSLYSITTAKNDAINTRTHCLYAHIRHPSKVYKWYRFATFSFLFVSPSPWKLEQQMLRCPSNVTEWKSFILACKRTLDGYKSFFCFARVIANTFPNAYQ